MQDLIKALTIFSKYVDKDEISSTHCEHDTLYVIVDPSDVSPEDREELKELSFHPSVDRECFYSYRFGSA